MNIKITVERTCTFGDHRQDDYDKAGRLRQREPRARLLVDAAVPAEVGHKAYHGVATKAKQTDADSHT